MDIVTWHSCKWKSLDLLRSRDLIPGWESGTLGWDAKNFSWLMERCGSLEPWPQSGMNDDLPPVQLVTSLGRFQYNLMIIYIRLECSEIILHQQVEFRFKCPCHFFHKFTSALFVNFNRIFPTCCNHQNRTIPKIKTNDPRPHCNLFHSRTQRFVSMFVESRYTA